MPKKIKQSLLNKTVSLYKDIGEQYNEIREKTVVSSLVSSSVKMRITSKKSYGDNEVQAFGQFESATHLCFTNSGIDIEVGYWFVDNDITYEILYVDKEPGGEIGHHYEVFAKTSEARGGG